jgi:hypothetical protein
MNEIDDEAGQGRVRFVLGLVGEFEQFVDDISGRIRVDD